MTIDVGARISRRAKAPTRYGEQSCSAKQTINFLESVVVVLLLTNVLSVFAATYAVLGGQRFFAHKRQELTAAVPAQDRHAAAPRGVRLASYPPSGLGPSAFTIASLGRAALGAHSVSAFDLAPCHGFPIAGETWGRLSLSWLCPGKASMTTYLSLRILDGGFYAFLDLSAGKGVWFADGGPS